MKASWLYCSIALVFVPGFLRAATFNDRVEGLFRPALGEMMTLSPDGRRVAYATGAGRELAIVVMAVEPPGPKRTVKLNLDRDAMPAEGTPPMPLRFLRWATADRLVAALPERIVPLPPVTDKNGYTAPNPDGPTVISPILGVDIQNGQSGKLVDARDFQETPADARRTLADLLRTTKELQATRSESIRWRMPHLDILGFFPGDREQLIIQTRGAYSMPVQYMVDIRTGSVREFGGNWPTPPGAPQMFDWYRLKVAGERKEAARPTTVWRDEEMEKVQRELDWKFPRRTVELLDWSETRARVLFRVTGGRDPGRIFVFQRPEDLVVEILRRSPWLNATNLNDTRFFEFNAPDGAPLSGYVTWPTKPRLAPPPLLLIFPSRFPGGALAAFDPEAQVFADMGFVVARMNHRSVAGLKAQDLTVLRSAVDRVSVDDARATMEWIAAHHTERPFDRRRVATLGRGFGGYLAVRALQLQPAVFRCGIAIDAPMDLLPWLRATEGGANGSAAESQRDIPPALIDHTDTDWKTLSVVEQTAALTNPVLLMIEPRRHPAIDVTNDALRARLQRLGRSVEHLELDPGFATADPRSRANAYRSVEAFLNLHLNGFAVKMGPAKEVE